MLCQHPSGHHSILAHTPSHPAKPTMLTGLMPRDHGAWSNGMEMRPRVRTLPQTLVDAGYRTASVGKLHYSRWIPDPDMPVTMPESLPDWNGGNISSVPLP